VAESERVELSVPPAADSLIDVMASADGLFANKSMTLVFAARGKNRPIDVDPRNRAISDSRKFLFEIKSAIF